MPRKVARAKSAAERQAAYRERNAAAFMDADNLVVELIAAGDRGRCSKFFDNLPEERQARYRELARRFKIKRIIVAKLEPGDPYTILCGMEDNL